MLGRIAAPFGIKGWVKVQPNTAAPRNLLSYRTLWIGSDGNWQERAVVASKVQGRSVIAQLQGCDDRDAAVALRGQAVAVAREALPRVGDGEYYWADLIGLAVVNTAGQDFGRVADILATGANDVLVVQGERERLIPFIATVVRQVDVASGVIRVDWDVDY